MIGEPAHEAIGTIAPNIIRTTEESIRNHFRNGERNPHDWSEVVGQAREKIGKGLGKNEQGLVIGVGDKSDQWKRKGFKTLDIKNRPGVDIPEDFNWIADRRPELVSTFDFIYAENIAFDPNAIAGVHAARLVHEANLLLKRGGCLVVRTGWHTHPQTTLPEKERFEEIMFRLGFDQIVSERHQISTGVYPPIEPNGEPVIADSQNVIYYGIKAQEIPDILPPGYRDKPLIGEEN